MSIAILGAARRVGFWALLGMLWAGAALPAEAVTTPESRPATLVRHPEKAWLQAIVRAGNRLVAVGERGLILYSDDTGRSWIQARVPVAVTMTAVFFVDERHGWAVGHYGTVLHSDDGGKNWRRQLDGVTAAQIELAAAGRQAGAAGGRRQASARRLVDDGPDKPFLDLLFFDADNGIVVGAYNLAFRTSDGGRTWESLMGGIDNPGENHLYAIRGTRARLYIVGEQGLVLRSSDGGRTFGRLTSPYEGSYFSAAVLPSGDLVVAGLRGNAYRLTGQGDHWTRIELPTPVSVTALAVDGQRLYFANQAGQVYESEDDGQHLKPRALAQMPMLTGLLPLADGSLFATGLQGVARLAPASTVKDSGAD
ncbi:WD40/YVTN/BNR-like repeat-containing protein [Castellaniella sp.]|uniref:WD40/YVTN/BNR-like repeat-containing protein n=1 Tax=Castellaniella sp. TaxID=1955812 RepID=UPI002AFEE3A2|nr:YCF48-related protein [Castellaniella sp.]